MNCLKVEELLPLYAGGDVEDAGERAALAEHLQDCHRCRAAAREWTEAVSLLRLHEPPEFDASFFDGVRNTVMQQIAETPATSRRLFPQPSVLLARLFEHRSSLAFAASIALLVAVAAATAIHFSGNHDAHRGEPYATSLPGAPASGKDNSHAGASVVQTTINESFTPTLVTSRFKQKPGRPARRQATRTRSATGNGATAVNDDGFERVEAAGAQTATLTPVESATLEAHPATKELNGEASASSVFIEVAKRKTTRIELQTGDPNVRIIWLAPQTNGQQLLDKTTNNR